MSDTTKQVEVAGEVKVELPPLEGSFACPICGRKEPHRHNDEDIARWRAEEAGLFQVQGDLPIDPEFSPKEIASRTEWNALDHELRDFMELVARREYSHTHRLNRQILFLRCSINKRLQAHEATKCELDAVYALLETKLNKNGVAMLKKCVKDKQIANAALAECQRDRDALVVLLSERQTKYLNGHQFGCPVTMAGANDCYCGYGEWASRWAALRAELSKGEKENASE